MGLETVTNVEDLNASNPVDSTDTVASMAAHIRNIKTAVKADVSTGAVMTKGAVIGAGTVDAITANFTPDVTLTNFVTVFVRAVGQITVTTPTFTPDGVASKTIVKENNAALVIEDIQGSAQILMLQFDSTLDKWILLNPAGGNIGPAITNYDKSGTFYPANGDSSFLGYNIASTIGSSYESIGPTGAGADNLWTELDDLPSNAIAVLVNISNRVDGATIGDTYRNDVFARKTGAANGNIVSSARFINRSASLGSDQNISQVIIPVDSSNRIDMLYQVAGTAIVDSVSMTLLGFWA